MHAVTVTNLIKKYVTGKQTTQALQGISFEVAQGELYGIIGPDGSGKTSLFRILTTLLLPDLGCATVDGLDVVKDYKAIRQRVGYMPGKFSLYQDLSVEENLEFFATIFNTSVRENYYLIKDIYSQIEPFKHRKAGKLSGGMKQKLALSCALIHRPSVLFLDEPTTGVDVVSRKEFWEMLKKLREQGISILVSTPYMDEAGLCDKVALIQNGKLLSVNTPAGITNDFKNVLLAVRGTNMLQLLKELKSHPAVADIYPFGEYHHLIVREAQLKPDLFNYLEQQHIEVREIKAGIEDCFIALMKARNP